MRKLSNVLLGLAAFAILIGPANAATFDVRYESEAPGMQHTTATFSQGGVETFDSLPTGSGQTFTSNFGNSGFTGQYANLQVNAADQYGGSGGAGRYAVSFPNNDYSLNILSAPPGGATYFGYWLSALDPGNQVTFYSQGQKLFTFAPSNVISTINAHPNPGAYYGNPNANFQGQDGGEPFAYLNFFATGGVTFDKVVFSEVNYGGGYESDNHTVGRWLTQGTGTSVPVSAVPEPSTWLMMLVGLGLVGAAIRASSRKPQSVAASA